MRTLLSLVVAFVFFAYVDESSGQDKKKGGPISGTVKKVDMDSGTITVSVTTVVKKAKETADIQYRIADDTKVSVDGKELEGKEGVKAIKEGVMVTITLDKDFKTISVRVGGGKK